MPEGFPEKAKVNSALGILRLLYHSNWSMKLSDLAKLSKSNVDELLPQVSAALLLGLISIKGTDVTLTELGADFHKSDAKAKERIRSRLREFEPFRTVADCCTGRGFTTEQLAEKLLKQGTYWHTDDRANARTIQYMLMQWAVYFRIAEYDGIRKRWKSVEEK